MAVSYFALRSKVSMFNFFYFTLYHFENNKNYNSTWDTSHDEQC
jgi:hypothetical protein